MTGEQILNEMSKSKSGTIDSNRTQIFVDDFKQGIEESLKQAAENAISNILIDLSKNPEKIGLLQKGIIANIENGLKGPDERVRNINTRKTIESATERRRYEDWLESHSAYKQLPKNDKSVLSKNSESILTMRQLKTEFDFLFKNVKNETKKNGYMTDSETELYKKSKDYKDNIKKSLDILEEKAKKISDLEENLHNQTNTGEEQEKIIKELNEATSDYNLLLRTTSVTYKEANKVMTEGLKDVRSEKNFIDDPNILRKKKYDDAKYALFRSRSQTRELQLGGYINAFNTTGSIGESFKKTMFNRATGYRQQRGLIGLAANLGYNTAGVAPALALTGFAKVIKTATNAVNNFAKGAIDAYGQLETVRTNLGIVYGSQSEANTAFNEIAQYATKSPFGVETVSQFAVQLKQSGVYASNLMSTLKQIGDVAGGNQQKFGNIANAFSQIEANGKATTRQLREFATAGIPIYAQLSKQLGKNVEQIRQMTAQGQISASIIEEAFSQLTGEGGMFHNAVNIGARTWAARRQNLADARQLSQAQLGQWAINFGGTSSTDNDSIAKGILNMLEGIYSGVENFFLLKNIAKDVSAIEKRDSNIKELEKAIEYAEESGNAELANLLKEKLVNDTVIRNYSQERASNAQSVGLYVEAEEEYNNILQNYKELKEQQEKLESQREVDELGRADDIYLGYHSVINEKIEKQLDPLYELTKAIELNIPKLEKTLKKTKEYYDDQIKLSDYYISKVESYTQKGFDTLSTYATKGSGVLSEVGTPNSLYKMYQDSIEKAKQTPAGKLRIEQQQEREWEEMRKKYNELSPYLNKTATLTEDNVISLEKLSEILKSGIINPLEKFDLTPERMSDNKYKAKSVGRTVEQNEADWKEFSKKIDSLRNIDLRRFSDKDIENLQNVFAKMFGGNASDFTVSTSKDGTKTFDKVSNFEEEVKNTEKNVKAFNAVFALFIKSLEKDNEEIAKIVESYLSSKGQVAEEPLSFKELNPKTDPYPLWQRIISNTLGVDLNLFKNTGNGKGWATNGRQALELYQKQMEKQTIKSVLSATMSSMGVRTALGIIGKGGNYAGSAYSVSNNSQDGTRQINWKELYKNTKDFAMSMESSAEVTRAYADSLSQSQSALEDFLSSSITQMEEPANIWDKSYQKVLGGYAENIKAVDANAFDMLFEELAPGVYKMREGATDAAYSLLSLNRNTMQVAEAMASAKDKIKGLESEIKTTTGYSSLLINNHNRTSLFGSISAENTKALTEEMMSMLLPYTEKGQLLENKALFPLIQSYIDNGYLGKSNGYVTPNNGDREKQIEALNQSIGNMTKNLDNLAGGKFDYEGNQKKIYEIQNQIASYFQQGKGSQTYALQAALNDRISQTEIFAEIEQLIAARDKKQEELKRLNEGAEIENNKAASEDEMYELLKEIFDKLLEKYKAKESQESLERYYGTTKPLETYTSPFLNGERRPGSDLTQQYMLNKIGETGTWNNYRNKLIQDEKGNYNLAYIRDLANSKTAENDETLKELLEKLGNGDLGKTFGESINQLGGEGFKALLDALDKVIEKELQIGDNEKFLAKAFSDLGTTAKETMKGSFLDGFNKSAQLAGKNMRLIRDNVIDSEQSSERLEKAWRDVAVEMLSSLGTTMTQTGLTLLAEGAKTKSKGMMAAGAGLIAAGGVVSVMGGFLSSDNDKEVDKNKQEEARLKALRDLLKEIIDQAKTDAQYYESNMRHKNAISVQAVNDAIITPNGNVVTTHPDDYLIATKTPGSLVNNNQTKVEPKVSLTVVNASGTPVNAEEKNRKVDSNGNIEIELMLTNMIGQKIANGDMDGFFDAREYRKNGRTYIG